MKFIKEGKVYDTEKSKLIYKIRGHYPINEKRIFKTRKGAYFCVDERYDENIIAYSMLETEVIDFIAKNDYEKCIEIFGELEEA